MKSRKIFAIATLLTLGTLSLSLTSCNLQGPQGVEGPKGDTGNDGINGKDGTSVLNGKGAPTKELGNVGDSYIDTETWDYYTKTSSGWIKQGNIKGIDGTNGIDGNQGIKGVPGEDGHSPVITIGDNGNWFIDGVDTNVSAKGPKGDNGNEGSSGKDGVSITKIELTSSNDNVDTYTIYYSDGNTTTFTVTSGTDGTNGIQGVPGKDGHTPVITIGSNGNWFIDGVDSNISAKGPKGDKGDSGKDGVSITNIQLTEKKDNVDTYTIYYSDGNTSTFTVTNGTDGSQGIQGEPGRDGYTPKITIGGNGNWFIDGRDTNIKATGPKGDQGTPGKDGTSVLNGNGVPSDDLGNVNDTYINLNNWDYYIKTSTGWVKKGNIKGGQGTPGKDGDTPTIGANGNWWIGGKDTGIAAAPTTYVPAVFNNYDGTMLCLAYFEKGSDVVYYGPNPTKPSAFEDGEEFPYTFIGWDKPLTNIQEPTVFTAQFQWKMYDVTFKNYDGTILSTQYCAKGDAINYEGTYNKRNDDINNGVITKYEFIGWDKSLENITSDTIFIAQYLASTYYEVTYVNYDDTVLYIGETPAGETSPGYGGEEPIRPQEVSGNNVTDYTFKGWRGTRYITEPTTFKAIYNIRTFIGHKVTFLNSDDSELYSHYFEEGTNVRYPLELPYSYDKKM